MSLRLLIVATLSVLGVACGEDVPWCGGDSISVTPLWQSGIAVQDTADVRTVIEAYDTHIKKSGLSFPDGAEGWVYEASSPDLAVNGVRYWLVYYRREKTGYSGSGNVYVDQFGTVVLINITVHAPCGP